ncbi:hydroxyethylthiazole kinase-like uncharacterized protein yjeF [Arthrobacter stackebrandtii]|uniref:Bifunctional NAD(P)H-hydrate repair enzyme n=1 Tax=Arthrobacter stackebrandtii TaxID=272161 RepID=A0ABS4YY37_9MICC|nr:bifunctional ADP-dependent NAD(P)H-hydrate dehydratase/NAD(P)H-hydrate epimerase [Arthrobacter stackebrandtii]MBP2413360.1 hydroxyethylthiazole kinase-like uncharacterized protein yjeF [Arthrobacter stackebrandtii]PYG99547.1 bifunctional ADP-dependent NAD(P)H-hydrate dehydratase/NAD(P)H-hydrate epimerase [Arthrobacter stackebrandtii]
MLRAHAAAAVRAAEQPLLAAGRGPDLMRKAALGLAHGVAGVLRARGRGVYGARAVLLAGSGNNGGDALYAGAWLAARGTRTTALLAGARTHPEALAAFVQAGGRCLELGATTGAAGSDGDAVASFLAEAGLADVVVDGLLGTGGRGGLRGVVADVVAALDALAGPDRPAVVACDLPSGVDATTGEVHGPVLRADLTVTFGALKTGLLAAPGEQYCGAVTCIDLGISAFLGAPDVLRLERDDVAALLPRPGAADHKYTRGVAGIIAGSAQYPGAGLLAVAAASACGPGMVRYLGPDQVAAAVHVRNPEVVCSTGMPGDVRVQAWLAGPGIDGDGAAMARAAAAMAGGVPTVVDAAALALVRPAGGSGAEAGNSRLVLTPHAGELSALFRRHGLDLDRAAVEAAPLAAARRAADLFGATVLLKGATTVVASPGGPTYTQANGTPALATAGSGDTLAGILVALLAMGDATAVPKPGELARTAALAAALHGELARLRPGAPLSAGQLAGRIPQAWARLCQIKPV